jgi:hypothetical protein
MPPITRSKNRGQVARGLPSAPHAKPQTPISRSTRKRKKTQNAPQGPSKKPRSQKKPAAESAPLPQATPSTSPPRTITINRAPVLTLWAAIVAERQGYSFEEGLTIGRWVSGVLAQSKGRALGIYEAKERSEAEKEARRRRDEALGVQRIDVFGMHVPTISQPQGGIAAVSEGKPIDPGATRSYLEKAFGHENLTATMRSMRRLASCIPSQEIGKVAYSLYERLRPAWKGWGQPAKLDLNVVESLAESWRHEGGSVSAHAT